MSTPKLQILFTSKPKVNGLIFIYALELTLPFVIEVLPCSINILSILLVMLWSYKADLKIKPILTHSPIYSCKEV